MIGTAWWTFVASTIILLSTALGIALDWKEHGVRKKRMRKALVVLAFLGWIVSYFFARQGSIEAWDSNSKVAALIQEIKTLENNNQQDYERSQNQLRYLNDQLSDLRSQVKTQELKKNIGDLQKQLSVALQPKPAPILEPSFYTIEKFVEPIRETTLKLTGNFVTVEFYVFNNSDVVAINGSVHLRICMSCKFAKEPEGFHKIPGAPDWDRQYDFQQIYPRAALQRLTADIVPPPTGDSFQIAVMAVCHTCPPQKARDFKVTVQR